MKWVVYIIMKELFSEMQQVEPVNDSSCSVRSGNWLGKTNNIDTVDTKSFKQTQYLMSPYLNIKWRARVVEPSNSGIVLSC